MRLQDVEQAIRELLEEGLIIISGVDSRGDFTYKTIEQATQKQINESNNILKRNSN